MHDLHLILLECIYGGRDVIKEGLKDGDEYKQPEGYIIIPMGNLTEDLLPTNDLIDIPQYVSLKFSSVTLNLLTSMWPV